MLKKLFRMVVVSAAIGIGLSGLAVAQKGGQQISLETAKAAGAQTYPRAACMAECKSRGPSRSDAQCAQWCAPGKCYYSGKMEPYCIR